MENMHWALVTGAARNLGESIAYTLAENGNNVLIHYCTNKEMAEQVAKKCRTFGVQAECIQGEFNTLQSIKIFCNQLLKMYPHVNCLINNVGNYFNKPSSITSLDEWSEIFHTNLYAPIALVQALLHSLIQTKGSIINIGSAGITLKANNTNTAYICSKTSLLIYTKSLAKELAHTGVRVNMISPGQLAVSVIDVDNIPVGYPAEYRDVTNAMMFLLNKNSQYITGQNIEIAGGLCL